MGEAGTGADDAGTTPLREALRHSAAALSAAEVPFAVAGSWALWCHGAAEHGGVPIDDEVVAGAEVRQLFGVWMPVLPPTVVVTAKLGALTEHYCDYGALLPLVRAVREQLDWPAMERDVAGSPYAESFLHLARRLGISGRA